MARAATVHVCSECGVSCAQWRGQCPGCGAWNTLAEERVVPAPQGRGRRGPGAPGGRGSAAERSQVRLLGDVGASPLERLSTGTGEFDRVLGGGLVPGSLVLLGGAPGIGKSTLTNMVLAHLEHAGVSTLYVSGEESAEQVRLRAERLAGEGAAAGSGEDARRSALRVPVLAETGLERVLEVLYERRPQVCVIDSVQTLACAELGGAPGTVGQVREVAARLLRMAKEQATAVILVGHVTKEGSLAGPRVLEHMVD